MRSGPAGGRRSILSRMTKSLLSDPFAHHVWASLRVLDACLKLSEEQLQTAVPGTYGSILDTARHLVGADRSYLSLLSERQLPEVEEEQLGLADLRRVMVENEPVWEALVARAPDPDREVVRQRDDGSRTYAPMGIRLAQVIHHGTDHRSQICTALTTLGIEPPAIDVWDFGAKDGRVYESQPTT
jgi:uncharacterized damage-inducible protein DinB